MCDGEWKWKDNEKRDMKRKRGIKEGKKGTRKRNKGMRKKEEEYGTK